MGLNWSGIGSGAMTVSTSLSVADGRLIRLIVEQVPEGSWDWMVWQSGAEGSCRHGVSDTRAGAIAAAEAAADRYFGTPTTG